MNKILQETLIEGLYYSYKPSLDSKRNTISCLKNLEKKLSKLSELERSLFVSENQKNLSQLQNILRDSKIAEFTSYRDKIFKNLLRFNANLPIDIPKIFANFIKGITYFSNEEDINARPIYHRLYSCGERGDSFYTSLHTCSDTQTPESRRIAEERIYKCYLERLIFDNIYKNNTLFFPKTGSEIHSQDIEHQTRLAQTREDFKSCFPNIELKINIDYIQNIPNVITIIKKINGKIRYTEVYSKEDSFVKCIITKSSGVFMRLNTFDSIGRTVKIDINTL